MVARKKTAKKAKSAKTKTKAKSKVKTTKRAVAKKAPAKKVVGPLGKVSSVYTKSALLSTLAERTGVAKKDVTAVIGELAVVVEGHLKKGGPGKFTLPGLLKMTVKNSPAKKARKGINPFTGEPTTFKAKPASRKVKITALKALKEMAV